MQIQKRPLTVKSFEEAQKEREVKRYDVYLAVTNTDVNRKFVRGNLSKAEVDALVQQLRDTKKFVGKVLTMFEGKRWVATATL